MFDRIVSEDTFLLKNCTDEYKTSQMCNEAVDDFWTILKLFLIGFSQGKFFANNDILFLIKILVKSHFSLMKWIFL